MYVFMAEEAVSAACFTLNHLIQDGVQDGRRNLFFSYLSQYIT